MSTGLLNVFVTCNGITFGLLVPSGCTYDKLFEMIARELKINVKSQILKIEYEAGGNMASIRISNDNSLLFYLELKRKEPQLTAYALHVEVLDITDHDTIVLENAMDVPCSSISPYLGMPEPIIGPTMHEFATTMDISNLAPEEYEVELEHFSGYKPSVEHVIEDQIFVDKKVMMTTMALYAIHNNFQYMVYKSDRREYVLKCRSEDCKWKFRASKMGKTDSFKVRYIRNVHTCMMDIIIRDHHQAKSSLIGEFIKHKYTSARTIYTPVDIMHDMSSTYGLTLRYGKAWRAREHALESVMGDPDMSYGKLAIYLSELEQKNVGTKTSIEIDNNGHFKYAFMSLGASIEGWENCKPVVVVDATYLTGRYGGTLFTACTQDANDSIYILSFGVGDSENNDSWTWFLRRFKDAYGQRDNLCFVSDRHTSIEHAVCEVYPGVSHGFCAHHILQNLRTTYGKCGSKITRPFNAAARAYTKQDFEYHMKQLDQINKSIRKDLEDIGYHKWSRAHMRTNRFSAMTSNIVESVNSVTKPVKHCPIDYLFESLRHTIQTWFSKNRDKAQGTFTRLASKSEELLRINSKHSLKLKVSASNDFMYQVSDGISQHVVDLRLMTCTCCHFQLDGIPCQHALAVIGDRCEQPYNYCSRYHTKDFYVRSYASYIVPLGDRSQWKVDNYNSRDDILPPISKRQPGRPKKARRRSRLELLKSTKCGRCLGRGHNRRTCKNPQPLIGGRKRKRGSEY